jgi:hypothetical protein
MRTGARCQGASGLDVHARTFDLESLNLPLEMKRELANSPVGAAGRLDSVKRCFCCNQHFTDSDQVAIISTESGWVCELPGDLAKYAVWQPGDAEVFHKACWERLGITRAAAC